MGSKKYSDELREEIRQRHAKGESYRALGEEYGIPKRSVEYICDCESYNGTLCNVGRAQSDESEWVDTRFDDARNFDIWVDGVKRKLREEMMYLGKQVVWVGENEVTYKTASGYNETDAYVDMYNKGIMR